MGLGLNSSFNFNQLYGYLTFQYIAFSHSKFWLVVVLILWMSSTGQMNEYPWQAPISAT